MANVEEIKRNSHKLRGTIAETLQSDTDHFDEVDIQLVKFHGFYQQDNRDTRNERRKAGLDREYIFMVRSKIPGGRITSEVYLTHDRLARELGNGSIRITSRQGMQLHGIVKGHLKEIISSINASGITTWGACGDVVRNVMASPWPFKNPVQDDVWNLARELAVTFAAKSRAYSEIWLNGEKMETSGHEEEPIYGEAYLPRKFKFGIAVPPRNEVDVYSHDVGLVTYAPQGHVEGFNILTGGGFGMSHGKVETYPAMGKPFGYVRREHTIELLKAIVSTQRDFGDREDRKHARMKYLVYEKGMDWFKKEILSRLPASVIIEEWKPVEFDTVDDLLGWYEQGDGRWFVSAWVPEGRIKDTPEAQYMTAFRTIAQRFAVPIAFTPNCNIIFYDIDPSHKDEVQSILDAHHVPHVESLTQMRKTAQACVSLPTCGLALTDSERVFASVLDGIDAILQELHLENEPILFRMTGCPNGCARPYNADFAFVGRAPGKYAFFVGGSCAGDRMAGLEQKSVALEDIPAVVRPYLEEYTAHRQPGERFSQYWGRTHVNGDAPHPDQFHVEFEKRAQNLAGIATAACGE